MDPSDLKQQLEPTRESKEDFTAKEGVGKSTFSLNPSLQHERWLEPTETQGPSATRMLLHQQKGAVDAAGSEAGE